MHKVGDLVYYRIDDRFGYVGWIVDSYAGKGYNIQWHDGNHSIGFNDESIEEMKQDLKNFIRVGTQVDNESSL